MLTSGPFLALGKVGGGELIIILLIVLVVFGPKQLPKLSQMLGETVKNFKKGMEDDTPAPEAKTENTDSKNEAN